MTRFAARMICRWPELLGDFGVRCEFGPLSEGAENVQNKEVAEARPSALGVRIREDKGSGIPGNVYWTGGAAQLAGLAGGDELVAIDGLRVTPGGLHESFAPVRAGRNRDGLGVQARRAAAVRDHTRRGVVLALPAALADDPSDSKLAALHDWLHIGEQGI